MIILVLMTKCVSMMMITLTQAFLEHIKGTQQKLLDSIREEGKLSPESDKALHKVR